MSRKKKFDGVRFLAELGVSLYSNAILQSFFLFHKLLLFPGKSCPGVVYYMLCCCACIYSSYSLLARDRVYWSEPIPLVLPSRLCDLIDRSSNGSDEQSVSALCYFACEAIRAKLTSFTLTETPNGEQSTSAPTDGAIKPTSSADMNEEEKEEDEQQANRRNNLTSM